MGAGRSRTTATVVRAGPRTSLVTLDRWHRGQILVPVESSILTVVTGCSLEDLPGTRLWVSAHIDALLDDELGLQDWQLA